MVHMGHEDPGSEAQVAQRAASRRRDPSFRVDGRLGPRRCMICLVYIQKMIFNDEV